MFRVSGSGPQLWLGVWLSVMTPEWKMAVMTFPMMANDADGDGNGDGLKGYG